MDIPIVRSATQDERQAVLDVLTLAFATDPLARWAVPGAKQYLALFPPFADAFGGNGLALGATYVVDGFDGAAAWLPPGVQPDVERVLAKFQEHVAGAALVSALGRCRPCLSGAGTRRAADAPRAAPLRRRADARVPRVHESPQPVAVPSPRLRDPRHDPGRRRAASGADAAAAALDIMA